MHAAHPAHSRALTRDFQTELDAYYTRVKAPSEAPRADVRTRVALPPRDAATPEFDADKAIAELCTPPVVKAAHLPSHSFRAQAPTRQRQPDPRKSDARLPPHEKSQDYLYLNAHQREQVAYF